MQLQGRPEVGGPRALSVTQFVVLVDGTGRTTDHLVAAPAQLADLLMTARGLFPHFKDDIELVTDALPISRGRVVAFDQAVWEAARGLIDVVTVRNRPVANDAIKVEDEVSRLPAEFSIGTNTACARQPSTTTTLPVAGPSASRPPINGPAEPKGKTGATDTDSVNTSSSSLDEPIVGESSTRKATVSEARGDGYVNVNMMRMEEAEDWLSSFEDRRADETLVRLPSSPNPAKRKREATDGECSRVPSNDDQAMKKRASPPTSEDGLPRSSTQWATIDTPDRPKVAPAGRIPDVFGLVPVPAPAPAPVAVRVKVEKGAAPPSSPPAYVKVEKGTALAPQAGPSDDEKFVIHVEHDGVRKSFRVRGSYSVWKVLCTACASFGHPKPVNWEYVMRIDGMPIDALCENDDTVGEAGAVNNTLFHLVKLSS